MFFQSSRCHINKAPDFDCNGQSLDSDCQERGRLSTEDEFRHTITAEMNNVGAALYDQGEHSTAIELYMDAMKLLMTILRDDRCDPMPESDKALIDKIVLSKEKLHNITETACDSSRRQMTFATDRLGFYQLSGSESSFDHGPQCLCEAFKIETLSWTSPDEMLLTAFDSKVSRNSAVIFYNIGLIFHKDKSFDRALYFFEQTVAAISRSSEPLLLSAALNNIGQIFYARGLLDKAMKNFSEALQVSQEARDKMEGNEMSRVDGYIGTIASNLGRVYFTKGLDDEALSMCEEALFAQMALHGSNHVHVFVTIFNLGLIHSRKGHAKQSMEMYKQFVTFVMSQNALSSAVVATDIAILLNYIGQNYEMHNMVQDAMRCYREALIKGQAYIQTHKIFAIIFYNVGMLHYQNEDYNVALQVFDHSIYLLRQILGDNHPDIAAMLYDIGIVQIEANKVNEALNTFTESVHLHRLVCGSDGICVANSLYNIGKIYQSMGEFEKAMESLQESIQIQKVLLGFDHSNIAVTLHTIGEIHHLRGEHEEAINVYEEVLALAQANNNSGKINVTDILTDIGNIYLELGDTTKAMSSFAAAARVSNMSSSRSSATCSSVENAYYIVLINHPPASAAA